VIGCVRCAGRGFIGAKTRKGEITGTDLLSKNRNDDFTVTVSKNVELYHCVNFPCSIAGKMASPVCFVRIADAHCDESQRFIVRADEKRTAFLELERAIRACGELV
jgi:hypothetical protein